MNSVEFTNEFNRVNSLVRRYPLHPNQYHQLHLFLKSHHQQQPWLQPTEKIRCLDDTIAWMCYNRMSFIMNNINHDNLNSVFCPGVGGNR